MKLYADAWGRRTAQVIGDLSLVLWVLVWVWVSRSVYDATSALAAPGRQLEEAGDGLAGNLRDAAESSDAVPVVGDELRRPFDGAGEASTALADAGRTQQEAVADLALLLGVTTFAVPVTLALLLWLPLRLRFVRRASAAQRFIDDRADVDLFALRALARQPMHRLARISDDPAGAWRRGDETVVRALAAAELRSSGLRLPEPAGRSD